MSKREISEHDRRVCSECDDGPTPAMLALFGRGPESDLPEEPKSGALADQAEEPDMTCGLGALPCEDEPSEADAVTPGRGADALPVLSGEALVVWRGNRDLKPDNIPLAIGSTWSGPDGTVYDIVAPGGVGERPRWWIWASNRYAPDDLHREHLHHDGEPLLNGDADGEDQPACALVHRAPAPSAVESELRREAERLRADLGATQAALDSARTGSNNYRDAYLAYQHWASAISGRLGSLASSDDAYREAVAEAIAETRSQFESAQRACEASRKEREEADKARHAAGAELHAIRKCIDGWEVEREKMAAEVSRIVREHIVVTLEPEPALEGLGRIELALVQWQAAWNAAHAKNVRLGKRLAKLEAAKPKPARKAKGKAGR